MHIWVYIARVQNRCLRVVSAVCVQHVSQLDQRPVDARCSVGLMCVVKVDFYTKEVDFVRKSHITIHRGAGRARVEVRVRVHLTGNNDSVSSQQHSEKMTTTFFYCQILSLFSVVSACVRECVRTNACLCATFFSQGRLFPRFPPWLEESMH